MALSFTHSHLTVGAVFFAGEGEWQEEEKTNEPPEV